MNAVTQSRPGLGSYDTIIVALSGGKDSVACLCLLLDAGVDPKRIELWHHDVDGHGGSFMDWPSTMLYVGALASAYNVTLYCSWRNGGFEAKMLREDCATAPVWFDTPYGMRSSGGAGRPGTRLRFPQVSADLATRWCSSTLKISVMDAAIRGQDRFLEAHTLVVTGERAQESANRALPGAGATPQRYPQRITSPPTCRSLAARARLLDVRDLGVDRTAPDRAGAALPALVREAIVHVLHFWVRLAFRDDTLYRTGPVLAPGRL